MTKTIVHVDINSYFATLLQQENPKLRGKPLGITKSEGRTCLIAVSKEAKKFGVKTGCRLKDALQLCPQIMTLSAQFDRYLDATYRLKNIFNNLAPDVYIYSLDEAFIDITNCKRLYPNPYAFGQYAQEKIKQELGEWVTCNVGISYNRLMSKMASETAPKGTIRIINNDNKDALLAGTTFDGVCGIGFRLGRKLERFGITVPYQIRFLDQKQLEAVFGPFWSKELLKIAYGEEPHFLQLIDKPQPHMKSVGRSITGYRLYDEEDEIKRILLNLMEEVTYKVRRMNLAGRYAWIRLYGHDQRWQAHQTLSHHIRHTKELFDILYGKLYSSWQRNFKVIKFAVSLGLLEPMARLNQPLLPNWHKQENIYKAMDKVSDKYGLFTLRSGRLLNQPIIKPEVTGFLGDRQYYGLG